MDEQGAFELLCLLEHIEQESDIVPVQGTDVVKAHIGEEAARHERRAHAVLDVLGRPVNAIADVRDALEEILDVLLCTMIARCDAKARQIL